MKQGCGVGVGVVESEEFWALESELESDAESWSRKNFGPWSRSRSCKIWEPRGRSQSRKNYIDSNFKFNNLHFLNQIRIAMGDLIKENMFGVE